MEKKCGGEISIVYRGSWERYVDVTDGGNVISTGENQVLDIIETSLWCSKCEHLSTYSLEDHGISEDWEEY